MNYCIATLTHAAPGRAKMLEQTVTSLLAHTEVQDKPDWYIYCNGYSEELRDTVRTLTDRFSSQVRFIVEFSPTNQGVGTGINCLNALTAEYEYTLFLEGDWACLHAEDSGQPTAWLGAALDLMRTEPEVDACYLRRFVDPIDSRQTGIQFWYQHLLRADTSSNPGLRYFICRCPVYTNNPLLRRNAAFHEKGVFPLVQMPNETRGNPDWGQAESRASTHLQQTGGALNLAILYWGVFVHIDNARRALDLETLRVRHSSPDLCGHFNHGASTCRWGFLENTQPHFCATCRRDMEPHQLEEVFRNEGAILRALEAGRHEPLAEIQRRILDLNPTPECVSWVL
jgi:hypothetical protein